MIFGTTPYEHCRIGGQWKRFVLARNICEGTRIRLGAPSVGNNDTLFVKVYKTQGLFAIDWGWGNFYQVFYVFCFSFKSSQLCMKHNAIFVEFSF